MSRVPYSIIYSERDNLIRTSKPKAMKQLEGLVYYPFPMPEKRMVNGKPVEESESDGEETKTDAQANQVLSQPPEEKKIALVIDTNVLLKQTQIRELLKVPDLATFES